MATEAQIHANRANAQSSTGPKSAEGKETSSRNAIRSGLSCTRIYTRGEEEHQILAQLSSRLLTELQPETQIEYNLIDRILVHTWNIQQCNAAEAAVFAEAAQKGLDSPFSDSELAHRLHLINRYRRSAETSHRQTMAELSRIQTEAGYRKRAGQLENASVAIQTSKCVPQVERYRLLQAKHVRAFSEARLAEVRATAQERRANLPATPRAA